MQYETCCHIKEDGAHCGSPALHNRKYCYYHLRERGRRLRRARALCDNVPYRLEIPPLLDVDSVQLALSEISQALGSGQLDHRVAGKMLYAIQQATSLIKYRAKLEASRSEVMKDAKAPVGGPHLPASGKCGADMTHVQEYPGFEQEFGISPGTDIDVETERTLRKADEQAELRQVNDLPAVPLGMRVGSAQFRVYREEAYQALNMQVNYLRRELRDYYAMKRKETEEMLRKDGILVEKKKAPASAAPASEPLTRRA